MVRFTALFAFTALLAAAPGVEQGVFPSAWTTGGPKPSVDYPVRTTYRPHEHTSKWAQLLELLQTAKGLVQETLIRLRTTSS